MKNNIEQQLQTLGQKIRPDVSVLAAAKKEVHDAIKHVPPGGLAVPKAVSSALMTAQNIIIAVLGVAALVAGIAVYTAMHGEPVVDQSPNEQEEQERTVTLRNEETGAADDPIRDDGDEEYIQAEIAPKTKDVYTSSMTEEFEVETSGEMPGVIEGTSTSLVVDDDATTTDESVTESPKKKRGGGGGGSSQVPSEDDGTSDVGQGTTTDDTEGIEDDISENGDGEGGEEEDSSSENDNSEGGGDDGNNSDDTGKDTDDTSDDTRGRRHPMRDMPEGNIGNPSPSERSPKEAESRSRD